MDFLIDTAGILVVPSIMFSFWRITRRNEYKQLRESGQKLNLNMHNLRSAFSRKIDDPLRESHIKLAKIGFVHWALIPIGFLTVILFGMGAILLSSH